MISAFPVSFYSTLHKQVMHSNSRIFLLLLVPCINLPTLFFGRVLQALMVGRYYAFPLFTLKEYNIPACDLLHIPPVHFQIGFRVIALPLLL